MALCSRRRDRPLVLDRPDTAHVVLGNTTM